MILHDVSIVFYNIVLCFLLQWYFSLFFQLNYDAETLRCAYILCFTIITCLKLLDFSLITIWRLDFLVVFTVLLLYEGKKIFRLLAAASLFLLLAATHFTFVYLSGKYHLLLYTNERFNMIIGMLLELLLFYLYVIAADSILAALHHTFSMAKVFFTGITPVCLIALLCSVLLYTQKSISFLYLFTMSMLVCINILIVITDKKIVYNTELKAALDLISYQNKSYRHQLDLLLASDDSFKKIKHDLTNHLLILRNYMENQQYETASNYLESIYGCIKTPSGASNTGNTVIDSLLNIKLHHINLSSMDFRFKADIPSSLFISDFDLTIVLGNLLDNALEALEKIPESSHKLLKIKLQYHNACLLIKISNSHVSPVLNGTSLPGTTKANASYHGIGLSNVKSVAEKYHGTLKIVHDQKLFTAYALLRDIKM